MYWYEKEAKQFSAVISTRVRFARNLEGIPFPARLDAAGREEVFSRIEEAYREKEIESVRFDRISPLERAVYTETRLASPLLQKRGRGSGLILSREGSVSMMISEEDHLRLQAFLPGKAIREAASLAMDWLGHGAKRLNFAYREGLGYLTSCPTNLGAGMRVSAMMHLPALSLSGKIPALSRALSDAGFTVRGTFGEGSSARGAVFQISNQKSRSALPEAIIESAERIFSEVENLEKNEAEKLFREKKLELEDRICRAVGTMRYAKKMDYQEWIELYSSVRLGKALGMEQARKIRGLDSLLILLMPALLELSDATLSDPALRDEARCKKLQNQIDR